MNAQTAPAVAGPLEATVRPVAWADDAAVQGCVGNCASAAAKEYWERGDWVNRETAKRLQHPLYSQAALDNARQAIYGAEAAQIEAPLRAKIEALELAEEGAKEAFGHVVQQKRDLDSECKRLRGLLDAAYADIRRMCQGSNAKVSGAGTASAGLPG